MQKKKKKKIFLILKKFWIKKSEKKSLVDLLIEKKNKSKKIKYFKKWISIYYKRYLFNFFKRKKLSRILQVIRIFTINENFRQKKLDKILKVFLKKKRAFFFRIWLYIFFKKKKRKKIIFDYFKKKTHLKNCLMIYRENLKNKFFKKFVRKFMQKQEINLKLNLKKKKIEQKKIRNIFQKFYHIFYFAYYFRKLREIHKEKVLKKFFKKIKAKFRLKQNLALLKKNKKSLRQKNLILLLKINLSENNLLKKAIRRIEIFLYKKYSNCFIINLYKKCLYEKMHIIRQKFINQRKKNIFEFLKRKNKEKVAILNFFRKRIIFKKLKKGIFYSINLLFKKESFLKIHKKCKLFLLILKGLNERKTTKRNFIFFLGEFETYINFKQKKKCFSIIKKFSDKMKTIQKVIFLMNFCYKRKRYYFSLIKNKLTVYYINLEKLYLFNERKFFCKIYFIKLKIFLKNFRKNKNAEDFYILNLLKKFLIGLRIYILKKKLIKSKGRLIALKRLWKKYRHSFQKKIFTNKLIYFFKKLENTFLLICFLNVKFAFKLIQIQKIRHQKNLRIKKLVMKNLLKKFIFQKILRYLEIILQKKFLKKAFKKLKLYNPYN